MTLSRSTPSSSAQTVERRDSTHAPSNTLALDFGRADVRGLGSKKRLGVLRSIRAYKRQTAELTLAVKSELLLTSLRWGRGLPPGKSTGLTIENPENR